MFNYYYHVYLLVNVLTPEKVRKQITSPAQTTFYEHRKDIKGKITR